MPGVGMAAAAGRAAAAAGTAAAAASAAGAPAGLMADMIVGIKTPLSRSIAWPAPSVLAALDQVAEQAAAAAGGGRGRRQRWITEDRVRTRSGIQPWPDRHLARGGQGRGAGDRRSRAPDRDRRRRGQAWSGVGPAGSAPVGLVSARRQRRIGQRRVGQRGVGAGSSGGRYARPARGQRSGRRWSGAAAPDVVRPATFPAPVWSDRAPCPAPARSTSSAYPSPSRSAGSSASAAG